MTTPSDILDYESGLTPEDQAVCAKIRAEIERTLPEATGKVWHGHPVFFLADNPIVGYSRLKWGVRLLFWSGQSFGESGLSNEGKFQAAEKRYTGVSEVDTIELARWLALSRDIQWDYANIVKRKGKLERLK
jgi:hypothetical protein